MFATYPGPEKTKQVQNLILRQGVPVPIPANFADAAGLKMLREKFGCQITGGQAAPPPPKPPVPVKPPLETVPAGPVEEVEAATPAPEPPPRRSAYFQPRKKS